MDPEAKPRVPFATLMALDRVDLSSFKSIEKPFSPGKTNFAYGGHVYAQAVYAAAQTVREGFIVHDVTGFFIRPAYIDKVFSYKVVVVRDGGSYCARLVHAFQDSDEPCFVSLCSFKGRESGVIAHQMTLSLEEKYAIVLEGKTPEDHPMAPGIDAPWYANYENPPTDVFPGLDMRKVNMALYNANRHPSSKVQLQYYSAIGDIPQSDVNLHACAHLYASDRNGAFLVTNFQGCDHYSALASLSHTVILHDLGEALLMQDKDGEQRWFCQEAWALRSGDGRGLHSSRLWTMDGIHLGTTVQDVLVRLTSGARANL